MGPAGELPETHRDPLGILDALEPLLENLRGMEAKFRQEGYTPEQSRALVAYMFGWRPKE